MKCPYCGSEKLVWDYKNGNLVCTECGSVIDQIYAESYDYDIEEENTIIPSYLYTDFVKKSKRIENILSTRKNNTEKYLIYNGSIIKETSLNSLKLLENNERLLILYDIIDNIPKFRSKSVKYKLALALYFYNEKEFDKLKKNLNISNKYMLKIISKIKMDDKLKIKGIIRKRLELVSKL